MVGSAEFLAGGTVVSAQLVAEAPNHIKERRNDDAQKDGSRQRKIEDGILAPIDDVSREAADGQVGASQQNKDKACHQNESTQENQHFSEFCHRENSSSEGGGRPASKVVLCDAKNLTY